MPNHDDAVLELARAVRRAIRERHEATEDLMGGYDLASPIVRRASADTFLTRVKRVDDAYESARCKALSAYCEAVEACV